MGAPSSHTIVPSIPNLLLRSWHRYTIEHGVRYGTTMTEFQRIALAIGLFLMCFVGVYQPKIFIFEDGEIGKRERMMVWTAPHPYWATDFRELITEWAIIAFATAGGVTLLGLKLLRAPEARQQIRDE